MNRNENSTHSNDGDDVDVSLDIGTYFIQVRVRDCESSPLHAAFSNIDSVTNDLADRCEWQEAFIFFFRSVYMTPIIIMTSLFVLLLHCMK